MQAFTASINAQAHMKTPKWYAIRKIAAVAAAAAGVMAASSAEILIYGHIGESWREDTVTAREFVAELSDLDVEQITVRINSLGGSVPDGLAIYNAIKRHKAKVAVEVDGVAFSIASLIAMAGDTVRMASNAMMMIHAPWGIMAGNAAELREQADVLDTHATAMAASYVAKTGRPQAEILPLLTDGKDHYYTAEEAKAEKLIDAIGESNAPAALAGAAMALASSYRDMPAAWLQACGVKPAAAPAASSAASAAQPQETDDMKAIRFASLLAVSALMNAAGADGTIQHGTGTGAQGSGAGAGTGAQPAQLTEAQRLEVLAADRTRQTAIAAQLQPFMQRDGAQALLTQLQGDPAMTAEAAGPKILAFLAQGTEPVAAGRVITVEAEADKQRHAQVNVLLARAGVRMADGKPVVIDASNPFRGHTLLDLAKAALARAKVRTEGMDKMAIVAAAFTQTSSDFPILLENTMNKTLQAAYGLQPLTWSRWCKKGSVSDFRAHNRYRRGSFGNLDVVNEAGEYKTKAVPDGEKARITAVTKGNLVNLTRVAIINDDLDAFVGIASDLGMAAARTVEADAIGVLTTNAALVQDNVQLFHATHLNVGTAAVPTVASFDEARQLMAKQTNVGGNDYLDLRPAIWLGPVAQGGEARVVNESQWDNDGTKLQKPNKVRGMFSEIIDTPRLTGTAWYALADPSICPTVEVAFLDGVETPYLELQNGFTVDGAVWKVRLDYGTAAVDFRGAVRNAGA
jgi:ATP-dependent protease ClpP protease subunit